MTFIRLIGLQFSLLVRFFSDLTIRVILASQKELEVVPPFVLFGLEAFVKN